IAAGNKEHPAVDEGAVAITDKGVKGKLPNPCTFVAGQYVCVVDMQAAVSGTYSANNGTGGAAITVTGHDFDTNNMGMSIVLAAFADPGLNGPWGIAGVVGTAAQPPPPAGVVQNANNKAFAGATYTLIQGAGPVPQGATTVDFINLGAGGTDKVHV